MKPHIPILAALLFATPAFANPVQTNSGNGAPSQAQVYGSGSASSSAQQQRQTQGQHQTATGGRSSATGGTATGGSSSVSNNVVMGSSGGGAGGVGPTVFVPDGTGQAPCGGGVGLGAGAMSAGGAGGGTLWEFGDCKRMRESAALRSLAVETGDRRLQQAALNELCQIDRIREAFGGQCPLLGQHMPAVSVTSYPYDWCATRNAGDRSQHLECDRMRSKR